MKKITILLLALLCFNIMTVKADEETNTNVLYPVNTSFNVVTDFFNYTNIFYNSVNGNNWDSTITIDNIHNLTEKKVPISISIGLFNSKKENIGVVNYCSTHDLESDFAFKMLKTGEDSAFSIKVDQEDHIAKNKNVADVAYIAVFDDNKYCKVGGKDNYVDLTLEEISNGEVSTKVEKLINLDFLKNFKLPKLSKKQIFLLVIVIVFLIIYNSIAKILNNLNKKIFNQPSAFAYIPISNMYLAVKLAFGPIIAKIYFLTLLIATIIGMNNITLPLYVSLVSVIAFFLDIIKLITKRYSFLYLEHIKLNRKLINQTDNLNSFNTNSNINTNNNIYDINRGTTNNNLLDDKDTPPTYVDLNNNSNNQPEKENSNSFFNFSENNNNFTSNANNFNNNDEKKNNDNNLNDNNDSNNISSLTDLFK